jgi:hypothetical protein
MSYQTSSVATQLVADVVVREGYDFDQVMNLVRMADRWERMLLEEKAEEEAAQQLAMESQLLEDKYQDLNEEFSPGELIGGIPWGPHSPKSVHKGTRVHYLQKPAKSGWYMPEQSKNQSKWNRSGKATRREFARRGW